MLIDYHLHTIRCGHAEGEMWEYLEESLEKGIGEVGFADHLPLYFQSKEAREPGIAMDEEELMAYVEDVRRIQKLYPDISIKLGIEADFVPGREDKLLGLLKDLPFDYVLGSVHFIDGWGFDNPDFLAEYQNKDIDQLYCRYFELLQQAALSGIFDSLAHPDLIKKFGFSPKERLTGVYEDTVKVIKKSGICIEVNTAGLRVPAQEIYPAESFLSLCFEQGIPVTLGSDAHKPEHVGQNFAEAEALLRKVGYTHIAKFTGRKREMVII
nr:histidinol-phosphatase HisJ family protein [Desulfolucanica intricata]